MSNLQEQVWKTFCYQKLFWPFTVRTILVTKYHFSLKMITTAKFLMNFYRWFMRSMCCFTTPFKRKINLKFSDKNCVQLKNYLVSKRLFWLITLLGTKNNISKLNPNERIKNKNKNVSFSPQFWTPLIITDKVIKD